MSFNGEVKLSDLGGSISHEHRNDSSDTLKDAENYVSVENTPVLVREATVSPETVPEKKVIVKLQRNTALLK